MMDFNSAPCIDALQKRYVVILGSYRSGSSCTAGILDRLGVGFGTCLRHTAQNVKGYFEHATAQRLLTRYFDEGTAQQLCSNEELDALLRMWQESLLGLSNEVVGFKHPLLCVIAPVLAAILEKSTVRYIAVDRPREEIISSLKRCNWMWTRQAGLRTVVHKLLSERDQFLLTRPHLRISFRDVLKSPIRIVDDIAEFLNIDRNRENRQVACDFVEKSLSHF
jgi:hypothetical protein